MLNQYIIILLLISCVLSGCESRINQNEEPNQYEYLNNKKCNFKIKYPKSLSTKVGKFDFNANYFALSFTKDEININCSYLIQLPIVEKNTNLEGKSLAIIFMHNPKDIAKFMESEGVNIDINNHSYYFRRSVDAGMSKQVIYDYYQPNGNNTNPIIITSLFSTDPSVFSDQPKEYTKNIENKVFFEMLSSYKNI